MLKYWEPFMKTLDHAPRLTIAAALLSLALFSSGFALKSKPKPKKHSSVVYVCACLGTKSCSCMTEAKTEGPCACGSRGGPPMKAVPAKCAWAIHNRQALSH